MKETTKQKIINIAAISVFASSCFSGGLHAAKGQWVMSICMLIMATCLAFITYLYNKNIRLYEQTKKIGDVLPYAAALALIARDLKDNEEGEDKKDENEGKETDNANS